MSEASTILPEGPASSSSTSSSKLPAAESTSSSKLSAIDQPMRAELFGGDHLDSHARWLAEASRVAPKSAKEVSLLKRFPVMQRELLRDHAEIVEANRREEVLTPDAEWLLDNFHIIEEGLREVREDLPSGYYSRLPKVGDGPHEGLPRVYALAVALISHTDASLDEGNVTRFVKSYQEISPLTIGELWAVPIMLRVVLLENLNRLAKQFIEHRRERIAAKGWFDAQFAQAEAPPPSPSWKPEWSDPFLVHLLQLFRDHGPAATPHVEWLEQRLSCANDNCSELLRREHRRQAADQVSVGNCVTSLRLLSNLDWAEFFETTSVVESMLRSDPARIYARQDFATKDRYRRRVEQLSRGTKQEEITVTQRLLDLCQASVSDKSPVRHVGYHLIGPGRASFERLLGYRPGPAEWLKDTVLARPGVFHFGTMGVLTSLIIVAVVLLTASTGAGWLWLVLAGLAAFFPALDTGVLLTHWLVTHYLPPRVLPKLDFKDGIAVDCPTFVVVPTLLTKPEGAVALTERLEVHFLSNPDPQLRFALLTDFTDSDTEQRPDDETILSTATARIDALNERYPLPGGGDRFFLFHRRRLWNPAEGKWMGWERKRGKLSEFNEMLRGAADTTFTTIAGDMTSIPRIRFVITLDSDTQMPRETARRLVAAIAHPLNQPRFDKAKGRVTEGYGVLQPRVTLSMAAGKRSLFSRVMASSAGIDPYTTAVSDVYQDLYGRGTFTGKGIYDLDAFESAVGHAFPENQILSHDLIEGNYVRCALVTDIELVDDFPARYHTHARRDHRWVRGDWQIFPWIFNRVPAPAPSTEEEPTGVHGPAAKPGKRANTLPLLERWKIFDNLRRSITPPALLVLLALGWTVLPGPAWAWTAFALGVLALPFLTFGLESAVRLVIGESRRMQLRELQGNFGATFGQFLFSMVFLADQARNLADAITRTLFRLFISRRRLLEWETAAAADSRLQASVANFFKVMWPTVAIALVIAVCIGFAGTWGRTDVLLTALPLLVCWVLSPGVAWFVSRSVPDEPDELLTEPEREELRRVARKTWLFFDTFVTAADHWLPPDNFQEDPKRQLARRTSPTNMGLYLISSMAANDFGYITPGEMAKRIGDTFDTFDSLERYNGHFFNWYDTSNKAVLNPAYISTVDSGNLLGCFITLKQGLLEKAGQPTKFATIRAGLADTLRLAEEGIAFKKTLDESWTTGESGCNLKHLRELLAEWRDDAADVAERLGKMANCSADILRQFEALPKPTEGQRMFADWIGHFNTQAKSWSHELANPTPVETLQRLSERADAFGTAMDFQFLYNRQRNLFAIGFNRSAGRLDQSHYDLLASESCLTSFLAVARGDVPRKHWFQLGRLLTKVPGGVSLVSWGGTMFEYLMPRLFMNAYPGTLIEESLRGSVARQIQYGKENRIPWGISESGFNALDAGLDYQYQSFGVPGLGLKRGLSRDLVIAPYATLLAVMVRPRSALENLRQISEEKGEGPYGYYEAIDYTRDRVAWKRHSAVVRSYMAHHQGMALTALAEALLGEPMAGRFHNEPMVRATELLLQERLPRVAPLVEAHEDETEPAAVVREAALPMSRRLTTADTPHPRTHLLSNGRYSVMITNTGAGYSTCGDLDVTRWREDRTTDSSGQFCYIRDVQTGKIWSAGHHPVAAKADYFEVIYSTDKAEFRRRDGEIETHMEVTVSPEHSAEIRRLTILNLGDAEREIELTSFTEVALLPHRADVAHPAFGKLFLETEWLGGFNALLCRRRPRASAEQPIWALHVLATDCPTVGDVEFESDRSRWLGRGRTPASPAAMDKNACLSGTTGPVLDPVFSLRRRIKVPAGGSAALAFTTAIAVTREEALLLADRFNDFHGVNRAFELAWAHSRVQLRHLHLSDEDVHLFQRLAAKVIYAGQTLRASKEIIASNQQGQNGLWRHGISGDKPIVLVTLNEPDEIAIVRQLFLAHAYWRQQGLEADLVILNEHPSDYLDSLNQQLIELAKACDSHSLIDKPGGIFIRRGDQLVPEDRRLLLAAARVTLDGRRGSLANQVDRREQDPKAGVGRQLNVRPATAKARTGSQSVPNLQFANGNGGFSADGREYVVIIPSMRALPPAPWVNVIANPAAGFTISEAGAGYTWAGNSQTNRITPWSNDPVTDAPGEAIFLRDDVSGECWTPTPLPLGGETIVRHGFGYSVFQSEVNGVSSELTMFVPVADPVKILLLKLKNTGPTPRKLSAIFYAEWVLGTTRDAAIMQVIPETEDGGRILARNPFNPDFPTVVAFADAMPRPTSFSSDRTEFLGRNGSVRWPAGLRRVQFTGRIDPTVDPCAALMCAVELAPGQEKEVVFVLGETTDKAEAARLAKLYREPAAAGEALKTVREYWSQTLTTIQVKTPDPAMDVMLNGWLAYQSLACRVWGRSATYQSGGAYGYRDQLQDLMAMVHLTPGEARAHIIRAASRQFPEGDVQHWWHPPLGRGVRTRFSDDFMWLPLAVSRYITVTGDETILEEKAHFLNWAKLRPEQEEDYGLPGVSEDAATVAEHCFRALDNGMKFGPHGLPLMGIGDWNDGMNKVGNHGTGESVWNAWFQLSILPWFVELAQKRGEQARSSHYAEAITRLKSAVETSAWDGSWYKRAYFDDGTPLGSHENTECRIDAIAQSWSVISGAGDPQRARQAMNEVYSRLVRTEDRLILLFTPPFDAGQLQPGYIKGYVPGIRENGGQYTHAATWTVLAAAMLGEGAKATELYRLLNPVNASSTPEGVAKYKVEPYVIAADVYGVPPHTGRGGWTWYTGSAGWMYRVGVEGILGFQREAGHLKINPCVAPDWKTFEVTYRHGSSTYRIEIFNPEGVERGVKTVTLDGQPAEGMAVTLSDDGKIHEVKVTMGRVEKT
ncbi:GH36-type glycosyl hydrolase domain-containing protein [Zavarzinella formosa]|uniref:GH36-type glycosyl hydrolase domain-containing protein n=1 Tax=Zavarzinella formosa TaxID=360055 RepID=UPI0002D4818B|nr:glucoamylase family protein [Zavarzinella formosa]